MPIYAVIWIDHQESRIFHVHPSATTDTVILAQQHHIHRHSKGPEQTRERPHQMHRFFSDIGRALDGVDAILLVGPSSAKLEFFRYVHQHERRLEQRVVGIETADHPTDAQMVARARSYFGASDQVAPITLVSPARGGLASAGPETGGGTNGQPSGRAGRIA
jgi:hypothetical protein